jgi:ATP-dependent DNA helicase PIF1
MVSPEFFTALDIVGCRVRKERDRPFGGIQLVLLGDFMQLPPIDKDFEERKKKDPSLKRPALFNSKAWGKCVEKTFLLTQVHRQKNIVFVELLNRVRMGLMTPEDEKVLRSRSNARLLQNGILPTRIYTHKSNVENENYIHLNKLKGEERTYNSKDTGPDEYAMKALQKNCLAPTALRLKVDAQVMLLKNLAPPLLVNGSRGRVVGFQAVEGSADKKEYPIVEFENGLTRTIGTDEWVTKKAEVVRARRTQVPLCLAWALTVHKCQGMTLDKATLDISRCFAPGQGYVGLSRCSTLEGLSLLGFNPKNIKADEVALRYYAQLGDECAKSIVEKMPATPPTPPMEAPEPVQKKPRIHEFFKKDPAPKKNWWDGRI